MIPPPLPEEAYCAFAPHGGRRIGPSVFSPSYQLVMNATDQVHAAKVDVATWAERVHRASLLRAEMARLEQAMAVLS